MDADPTTRDGGWAISRSHLGNACVGGLGTRTDHARIVPFSQQPPESCSVPNGHVRSRSLRTSPKRWRRDITIKSAHVVDQSGANLALDVLVLGQHLGQLLEVALRGTGVSPAQYAVYSQMARGTTSPKVLIEVLGLRPATLSGYLVAMERRGDLVRTRTPTDRRSHQLGLSERGMATHVACRHEFRRAVRVMNAQLGGAEEVASLRLALGRLDVAIRRAQARIDPEPRDGDAQA